MKDVPKEMDFLRDPLWQSISVVIALIAVLVTVIVYLKQRNHRDLSYEITSRTPLLAKEDEIGGALQVQYKGQPVKKVQLVEISFTNSGNTPILGSDFVQPITLNFGEEARILTADIIETSPENFSAFARIDHSAPYDRVTIDPILMNSGDIWTLKMLISNSSKIDVDCRVVGVREIRKATESNRFLVPMVLGTVVMVVGFIMTPVTATQIGPFKSLGNIVTLSGMGIMYSWILTSRKVRRAIARTLRSKVTLNKNTE